jgi:hypothetical protein
LRTNPPSPSSRALRAASARKNTPCTCPETETRDRFLVMDPKDTGRGGTYRF